MTKHRFKVVLEWDPDDSVWVSYVPSLNHLSTFGETKEEALAHTREAILGYIEAANLESIPLSLEDQQIELTEVEIVTA